MSHFFFAVVHILLRLAYFMKTWNGSFTWDWTKIVAAIIMIIITIIIYYSHSTLCVPYYNYYHIQLVAQSCCFFLSFIQKIAFISAGNGSMYFEPIRLVWFFYFLLTLFAQLHSICFCEFECDVIMTVAQVYLHQNHQILSSKNIPHLHLVLQQHHSMTRITQTRRKKRKQIRRQQPALR